MHVVSHEVFLKIFLLRADFDPGVVKGPICPVSNIFRLDQEFQVNQFLMSNACV